jgi:hypothetical protein
MFSCSAAGGDWANLPRKEGLLPHGCSTGKDSWIEAGLMWVPKGLVKEMCLSVYLKRSYTISGTWVLKTGVFLCIRGDCIQVKAGSV